MHSKRLLAGVVALGLGAFTLFAVGPSPPSVRAQQQGPFTVPHGNYSRETDLCAVCHTQHSDTQNGLFPGFQSLFVPSRPIPEPAEVEVCFSCHDGSGAASNVKTEFGTGMRVSTHPVLEPRDGVMLTCSDCHSSHQDPAQVTGLLYRRLDKNTYEYSTKDHPIGNAFCYVCHGSDSTLPAPFGDLTAFETSIHNTGNRAAADATGVTCSLCHDPHASDYTSLTKAGEENLCFTCHSRATPNTANGSNPERDFSASANDITTTDGTPIRIYHHPIATAEQDGGARQVECASCHNAHIADPSSPVSDPTIARRMDSAWPLGWDTASGSMTRADALNTFCTTCHVSPDTTKPLDASSDVPYNVRLVNDTEVDDDGTPHDKFDATWYSSGSAHGSLSYTPTSYPACPAGRPCVLACTACHASHGSSNAYLLREHVVSPENRAWDVTAATWIPQDSSGSATLTIGPSDIQTGWYITVSGVTPDGFNGTFVVTDAGGGSVTYQLDADPGPYVSGGTVTSGGPENRSATATITGFGATNTPEDRALLQTFCLTCHLEQSSTHHPDQLCTTCHNHAATNEGGF